MQLTSAGGVYIGMGTVISLLPPEIGTYLSEFPSKILNQISVLALSGNELNKCALNCLADIFPHMVNLTNLNFVYLTTQEVMMKW